MKKILPICAFAFASPFDKFNDEIDKRHIERASEKSSNLIKLFKETSGVPGVCVNVNVRGKYSLDFNYGYCDIENMEKCRPDSVMRIASISKSFTSLIAAKLIDEGLLDLDRDINDYLPDFPKKTFNSEKVSITCRELLSHRSGIRDYKKIKNGPEYELPEFLNRNHCSDSLSPLKCFQDDPLEYAPGKNYMYSVYGYVLLGSVLEKIAQKSLTFGSGQENLPKGIQFIEIMFQTLFRNLELSNTYCEYNKKILPNRSRQYRRNCKEQCKLEVAPYVDNSCKWAAGGIVSTCSDLSKMAQHLVDIWLNIKKGVISRKSLELLWKSNFNEVKSSDQWSYSLGWMTQEQNNRFLVGHTGGSCGGTSVLMINFPKSSTCNEYIIVTILCNLENTSESIRQLAVNISKLFEEENYSISL